MKEYNLNESKSYFSFDEHQLFEYIVTCCTIVTATFALGQNSSEVAFKAAFAKIVGSYP